MSNAMENRLFRIFHTKARIVHQVKQQTRLFEQNLATKLLIDGISPPSWLLASYRSELNAEDLISEALLSRPQFQIPFSSTNYPAFEEPVIEATNLELPDGFSSEGCAQNDGFDAGGGNLALIVSPVSDAGLASVGISAPGEDPGIFSPQEKREMEIAEGNYELPASLASFHRSRSRQKALEIRSSAKVSQRKLDDNSQSGYAGGARGSAIEKLNLAIPLETDTVFSVVDAAGISVMDEDPSVFSPQDQREPEIRDGNDKLPASLASSCRSRSSQKAYKLCSSGKVPKCQFDEENRQRGYAGGIKESAIEKLDLSIPLETAIVIPDVEAADIGGLWSKNSDNVYPGRILGSNKSRVVGEDDAMLAHLTPQSKERSNRKIVMSSLTGMKESRIETLHIEDCDISNASDFFQLDLCYNHNEGRRSLAQETEDLVISGGSSAELRSSYCDPNVDCLEPNNDQVASTSSAKPSYCSPVEDMLTWSKRRRIDLTPVPDCSPGIKENFVYPYEKDFVSSDFLHEDHISADVQAPEDVVHQTGEHNTQECPDYLSALKLQEVDSGLEERKTSNEILSSIVQSPEWREPMTNDLKSSIEGTVESLPFSLDSPHTQALFFSEFEGFVMQSDDDEQLCRVDKFSFDDIDQDGILEQLCKSASIETPLTSYTTSHTLHKESCLYQSVPTGLLENLDMKNKHMISDEFASAFQGRAHSDSFQTSKIGQDWDIKKPCLSPVRKVWDRVISKSGSAERRVSSNPELPCINEESENIEEIADTLQLDINETIASSVKRQPLGGIDENIPLSGAEQYTDRFSIDSVNTEFSFKNQSEKGKTLKRKYSNKENGSLSRIGIMGSLQNRISKQNLSTRTSSRSRVSSSTVMEPKRSNIVSNVTSFIPLVQQKQAAAVPTGKKGVKVKALEAAEAAKRLAEKKENERKIKKEAMKLERARQEQENIKLLEQQKQQKEQERKKKEAKLVEKKRQREGEERREKEKKRQRVEESRKQQRENEQKLQAAKEEKAKVNEQKLQAAKEEKEKLRSSVVASMDKQTRTESCVYASSQEPSYDISPYKCSDNEEEEEDEDRPNTKFIPSWATKNAVLKNILLQDKETLRTAFQRKRFCRISEEDNVAGASPDPSLSNFLVYIPPRFRYFAVRRLL